MDHRVGHVAHVHERAPHPAAAVEQQPLLEQRVLHEGVDHEVVAHPRAVAVYGAVAEDHRAQALLHHLEQALLRVTLRGRVRAGRLDRRLLVVHAARQPVVKRARRGEDEPFDAALDAGAPEPLGRDRVHLPVRLGVVLGGGVVGEPREVDHCVDPVERGWGKLAHVGHHDLDAVADRAQRSLAPVQPVERAHAVPAIEQPLQEHAADVAAASGDEHVAGVARALLRQAVLPGVTARQVHRLHGLAFHGPTR